MHISEGIMTAPVLATGWAICIPLALYSLHRINAEELPKMAVFSAVFFLASLIRVPIGASSAHFALLGFMGITLGYGCFASISIALFLQALLFQFGGLSSLGVNACIMGIPALLSHILFSRIIQKNTKTMPVYAFLAGTLPIFLATGMMFLALFFSHAELATSGLIFMTAHIPLGVLEGLITVFCCTFLRKVAPQILTSVS